MQLGVHNDVGPGDGLGSAGLQFKGEYVAARRIGLSLPSLLLRSYCGRCHHSLCMDFTYRFLSLPNRWCRNHHHYCHVRRGHQVSHSFYHYNNSDSGVNVVLVEWGYLLKSLHLLNPSPNVLCLGSSTWCSRGWLCVVLLHIFAFWPLYTPLLILNLKNMENNQTTVLMWLYWGGDV